MSKLTIVMYHYVRDIKHSRYPMIKGLDVRFFKEQLNYIRIFYNLINMEDLFDALKHNRLLPYNSLLLTFDDGYKDHFDYVFPILDEMGIQGSFFPPAKAIMENKVLDVNKIHFILASQKNKKQIIQDIYLLLNKFRKEYSLDKNEYYFNKLAKDNRFDSKETAFIKRILQRELPLMLRGYIINTLFNKYVSKDEESFSRELYMNIDQLKFMKRKGMFIGSHSYSHCWLDTLSVSKQNKEIDLSLYFLEKLGCNIKEWVMCYPYGAYNMSLLSLLKNKGCKIAFTTEVKIADLNKDNTLTLPRLDTNDLPKNRLSKPNKWTCSVVSSILKQ